MNDSCSICLEKYKNPRKTQCGHIFCNECIWEWKNEENYYGEKKETCPLCRNKIGLLTRVNMKMKNKKITKKKEPIKRVYRTRYKVAEERIQEIMNTYLRGNYSVSGPDMWEAAQKISNEGKVYLCHNKKMKEVFNMKMREFAVYDEKFLTLIKK